MSFRQSSKKVREKLQVVGSNYQPTLGPRVTDTASANLLTPLSISALASLPNLRSFAKPRTHCLAGAKPLKPILRNMVERRRIKINANSNNTTDTELPEGTSRGRSCWKMVVLQNRRSELRSVNEMVIKSSFYSFIWFSETKICLLTVLLAYKIKISFQNL